MKGKKKMSCHEVAFLSDLKTKSFAGHIHPLFLVMNKNNKYITKLRKIKLMDKESYRVATYLLGESSQ